MNILLTTILPFLFVFTLLVLAHELGHFFFAKLFGVRVEEFGIGLPPTIWKTEKKGTVYSINAVPIGGFVKLLGENGNVVEEIDSKGKVVRTYKDESPENFSNKPAWQRAIILVAGVSMNFLLSWLVFTLLFATGYLNKPVGLKIAEVVPDSPAAQVQILPEDTVSKITTKDGEMVPFESLTDVIQAKPNEEYVFSINRNGEDLTISMIPKLNAENVVSIGILYNYIKDEKNPSIITSIFEGLKFTAVIIRETVLMVGQLVHSIVTKVTIPNEVAGPVGIVKITSKAAQMGLASLLFFLGIISVNLAVLNIMPFPALDGGRLMVIILEAIVRKKLPAKWEMAVHSAGFILLLLFMFIVTWKDVAQLFIK